MDTNRGTYKIYDGYNDCYVYFYINFDNHPLGAAVYFTNMLRKISEYEGYDGKYAKCFSYAKCFLLGNQSANFIKSHKYGSDMYFRFYRYNLIKDKNENIILRAYNDCKNKTFYEGAIEGFVRYYRGFCEYINNNVG